MYLEICSSQITLNMFSIFNLHFYNISLYTAELPHLSKYFIPHPD